MSHALKGLFFASILVLSGLILPFAFAQNATLILSPLKQFKAGIFIFDIKCNQELVIKTSDDSPACVKLQTAQKLVERGWALNIKKGLYQFQPLITRTSDEVRNSDLLLTIMTAAQQYITGSINVTLTITNLGINDLTINENNQLPLSIDLYYLDNEPNYKHADFVKSTCQLKNEQDPLTSNNLTFTLKTKKTTSLICTYDIVGGKIHTTYFEAIGNLNGLIKPLDEKKNNEKPLDYANPILSTRPIFFGVTSGG